MEVIQILNRSFQIWEYLAIIYSMVTLYWIFELELDELLDRPPFHTIRKQQPCPASVSSATSLTSSALECTMPKRRHAGSSSGETAFASLSM